MNYFIGILLVFLLLFRDRRPYWRIVKKWCQSFNLEIKYTSRYEEIFACDPDTRVVYICKYNKAFHDKQVYIYSIAHELGHLIGFEIDEEFYIRKKRISNRITKEQVIADEIRAWKIAELLLKDAKLYEKESFEKLRDRCLHEYDYANMEQI